MSMTINWILLALCVQTCGLIRRRFNNFSISVVIGSWAYRLDSLPGEGSKFLFVMRDGTILLQRTTIPIMSPANVVFSPRHQTVRSGCFVWDLPQRSGSFRGTPPHCRERPGELWEHTNTEPGHPPANHPHRISSRHCRKSVVVAELYHDP